MCGVVLTSEHTRRRPMRDGHRTSAPASAYVPGYEPDTLRMLTARTAAERAGMVLPRLADGMRILDLGCGPGSITTGLAAAVAPQGVVLGVDLSVAQLELAGQVLGPGCGLVAGRAEALPVRAGAVDAVHAHAVFEHLTAPDVVLAEIRRVLRTGGLLALSSSDWSGATVEPRTAAVDTALRAYVRLRQRGGTDPFAGSRLAGQVRAAGFAVVQTRAADRVDMGYTELAAYLRDRLTAAAHDTTHAETAIELATGARAAAEWVHSGPGYFTQRWVEVVAITAPAP